jgi:hypothetical protein
LCFCFGNTPERGTCHGSLSAILSSMTRIMPGQGSENTYWEMFGELRERIQCWHLAKWLSTLFSLNLRSGAWCKWSTDLAQCLENYKHSVSVSPCDDATSCSSVSGRWPHGCQQV